jgi:hypothetical protein
LGGHPTGTHSARRESLRDDVARGKVLGGGAKRRAASAQHSALRVAAAATRAQGRAPRRRQHRRRQFFHLAKSAQTPWQGSSHR